MKQNRKRQNQVLTNQQIANRPHQPGRLDRLYPKTTFARRSREVIDPELFVTIVDLGLIYTVNVKGRDDAKYDVDIEMTMTSPMCPAGPQLVANSRAAIEKNC